MITKKPQEPSKLDWAIDVLITQMCTAQCDTKEYATMVDHLSKLYKLREVETPKRVSPDTIAIIAGNLAGIVLILSFERLNVVTSKAIGFVMKLR